MVTVSKSYATKQKWVFYSEHSVYCKLCCKPAAKLKIEIYTAPCRTKIQTRSEPQKMEHSLV